LDISTKDCERNNSSQVIFKKIPENLICKINFLFRDQFWPNGILADKAPERDASIRNITQVLCKAKLLGIVSGKNNARK
jgi:hypothetical protein